MDIQATKLELIQHLLSVEKESILEKVKEILLEDSNESEIISYTTSGTPLNIEQYKAKIQRGIDDYEMGRVTSDEDLEKEIDTW